MHGLVCGVKNYIFSSNTKGIIGEYKSRVNVHMINTKAIAWQRQLHHITLSIFSAVHFKHVHRMYP